MFILNILKEMNVRKNLNRGNLQDKKLLFVFFIISFAFLLGIALSSKENLKVYAACPAGQHEESQNTCDGCYTDQKESNCRSEWQGACATWGEGVPGCGKYVTKCDYTGGTWHQCCGTYSVKTVCIQNPPPPPTAVPLPTATPAPTSTPAPTVPPGGNNSCPVTKGKGDANCDGVIDLIDYSIWLNNQCHPGSGQSCGDLRADFNGDGNVDDADYTIWQAHFGQ